MPNNHYLERYQKFIENIRKLGPRELEYSERHHILPRCMGGSDEHANLIDLRLREHFICHWMLYKAHPNHLGIASAFLQMVNKNPRTKKPCEFNINSRVYEKLKIAVYRMLSEYKANKVYVKDSSGNQVIMTREEYSAQNKIQFHTKGKIYVFDKQNNCWVYISSAEYQANKEKYLTRLNQEFYQHKHAVIYQNIDFRYLDSDTGEVVKMPKNVASELNEQIGRRRYLQIIKSRITCQDDKGNKHTILAKEYDPAIHTHILKDKIIVWDNQSNSKKVITRDHYGQDPSRYLTSTKGKVVALDTTTGKSCLINKSQFDKQRYVGITKNLTTVLDKTTGNYVQIPKDQMKANPDRYTGPCTGKVNVINKHTGIRSQISKDQYDPEIHLSLGNKKFLFKCQHLKTGKIKNINIYEWHLVKNDYDVLEENKLQSLLSVL